MQWSKEYETGDSRLDEQHKLLFRMVDDYVVSLSEGKGEWTYGLFLDFLDRFTKTHFSYEEGCMASCRCAAMTINATAHSQFVTVLTEYRTRFYEGGFKSTDAQSVTLWVEQWLTHHVARVDTQLRTHYTDLPRRAFSDDKHGRE